MNILTLFVKQWRFSLLLMIAGSVLGYGSSFLRSPAFQATAYLRTDIDYSQTGSLDELETDRMLGITEDILSSDAVIEGVYQSQALCDDVADLRKILQIERSAGLWALSAFSSNAEDAVSIARVWLQTGYTVLLERHSHALQAELLTFHLEGLTTCFQNAVENHAPAVCAGTELETILSDIQTGAELVEKERELSGGLSPAIVLGPLNSDMIQLRNLHAAPCLLTLSGMFAGLFLSLILTILRSSDEKKGLASHGSEENAEEKAG